MHLTTRQWDMLRLGALGYSNKEIADELNLSENSVKVYFYKLSDKIHLDRHKLTGLALLLGLISIADITRAALEIISIEDIGIPPLPVHLAEREGAD